MIVKRKPTTEGLLERLSKRRISSPPAALPIDGSGSLAHLTDVDVAGIKPFEVVGYDGSKFVPIPMLFFQPGNYGALGTADDRATFQAAIDAAAAAGGGHVQIPVGTWIIEGELRVPDNVALVGSGPNCILKRKAKSKKAYLVRNENTGVGNKNIRLAHCTIDGNKAEIEGERSSGENPSAEVIFTAEDGHLCENIVVEGVYQRNGKRLGIVFVNVKGGSFTGTIENNGRDAFTLFSNTCDISFDYLARGCGDDGLGLNSENDPEKVHDLHNIKGKVTIIGPGDDGPGIGMTVRGGRDIDVDLFASGIDGWALGIFDAYETKARNITVKGSIRASGGNKAFYSQAAVVLGASVIHKVGGPYAAIEEVSLEGLKVFSPGGKAIEIKSERGAYGALQHVYLNNTLVTGATTAIELGDYLYHVCIGRATIHNCENGIVSTHSNVLRLEIVNPSIFQINGGFGVKLENASGGVLRGVWVDNEGNNGQTGIRAKNLFGTWSIGGNYANECTTNYDFGEIGTPTLVEGFRDKPPIAKPEVKGAKGGATFTETILKALVDQGLLSDSTTAFSAPGGPPTGAAGGDLTGTYPEPTIGPEKVTQSKIALLAVGTSRIAELAITAAKIATGAIETAKLAFEAVTTEKIANLAVTAAKIAKAAVTSDKLSLTTFEKACTEALVVSEKEALDVPGCTYTTATAGTFLVLATFDVLAGASGFSASGILSVDGKEQESKAVFAGVAANDRKPADTFWIVTAEAGKVIKLRAKKAGGTYTVQPTHTKMIVIQIG